MSSPSNIIDATELFQSHEQRSAPPSLPEFTAEDLLGIGIELHTTETKRLLRVPAKTQKTLAGSVKNFGFGSGKALSLLLDRILITFGIVGKNVKFHSPDGTNDLEAWIEVSSGATVNAGPLTHLVGFVGRQQSGKDTAAAALVSDGFENVKFAGALKAMLESLFQSLGLDADTIHRALEGDLKEQPMEQLGWKTPRFALQTLGTNFGRDKMGENFWVDAALDRAKQFGKVVITDTRFKNEVDAIRALGGTIIRITRPSLPPARSPEIYFANEGDLQYAAGLIEGEGCFHCSVKGGRRPNSRRFHISVTMTDVEPLQKLCATIGGRLIGPYKQLNPKWKPRWVWNVHKRAECVALAKALKPFMSPRRQGKIQDIIDMDASMPRKVTDVLLHTSEQVDNLDVDFEIVNDGTVEQLHTRLRAILEFSNNQQTEAVAK